MDKFWIPYSYKSEIYSDGQRFPKTYFNDLYSAKFFDLAVELVSNERPISHYQAINFLRLTYRLKKLELINDFEKHIEQDKIASYNESVIIGLSAYTPSLELLKHPWAMNKGSKKIIFAKLISENHYSEAINFAKDEVMSSDGEYFAIFADESNDFNLYKKFMGQFNIDTPVKLREFSFHRFNRLQNVDLDHLEKVLVESEIQDKDDYYDSLYYYAYSKLRLDKAEKYIKLRNYNEYYSLQKISQFSYYSQSMKDEIEFLMTDQKIKKKVRYGPYIFWLHDIFNNQYSLDEILEQSIKFKSQYKLRANILHSLIYQNRLQDAHKYALTVRETAGPGWFPYHNVSIKYFENGEYQNGIDFYHQLQSIKEKHNLIPELVDRLCYYKQYDRALELIRHLNSLAKKNKAVVNSRAIYESYMFFMKHCCHHNLLDYIDEAMNLIDKREKKINFYRKLADYNLGISTEHMQQTIGII